MTSLPRCVHVSVSGSLSMVDSSSMSASTQTGTLVQLGVSPRTRRLSWLAKNVSYTYTP